MLSLEELDVKKIEVLAAQGNVCSEGCGTGTTWNGADMKFRMEFIDKDFNNLADENIRVLCWNCFSQTSGMDDKMAAGRAAYEQLYINSSF